MGTSRDGKTTARGATHSRPKKRPIAPEVLAPSEPGALPPRLLADRPAPPRTPAKRPPRRTSKKGSLNASKATCADAAPGTRLEARALYTIGHSTRSLAELVDILRGWGITRLVDIRTIPRSRTNPQFNMEALPDSLRPEGISYVQIPALGGRRGKSKSVDVAVNAGWQVQAFRNYADYAETPPFRAGLRELLAMASEESCAIMCAEAVWWRCHRRIVTDHVLAHGVPVVHLFSREKGEPASLTPFARVGDGFDVTYPVP
ncbi:MAG: DUF488 domain-containing protein [Polyangia bacterium]